MEEKVNVKSALRVFSRITSEGERVGDEYVLNGLRAYSDYDGYTITICNDYASLDIFFHNKFSFKFSNRKEKIAFLEKLNNLAKK